MSARHHADVLVLGHTLEAALAAALLARRGWNTLWLGRPPPSGEESRGLRAHAAPALQPPPGTLPSLVEVLEEVGLLADFRRACTPAALQILGERLRLMLPEDAPRDPASARAIETLTALDAPAEELAAVKIGLFGRGRRARQEQALEQALPSVDGPVARGWSVLEEVLGSGQTRRREAARALTSAHLFEGGRARLVEVLYQRFVELGGRVLPGALDARLDALEAGWSGASITSASGEQASGRVLLFGLADERWDALLPENGRTARKLRQRLMDGPARPLRRLNLWVRTRGLPVPLGPVAVLEGALPVLLERHRSAEGVDECAIFWRSRGGEAAREEEEAIATLRQCLPFFERHIAHRGAPVSVPGCGLAGTRPVDPMRRVLAGVPGAEQTGGLDGAAALAQAIAERAMKLAPREKIITP